MAFNYNLLIESHFIAADGTESPKIATSSSEWLNEPPNKSFIVENNVKIQCRPLPTRSVWETSDAGSLAQSFCCLARRCNGSIIRCTPPLYAAPLANSCDIKCSTLVSFSSPSIRAAFEMHSMNRTPSSDAHAHCAQVTCAIRSRL